MKTETIDALIYIESSTTDDELYLNDYYIPLLIKERIENTALGMKIRFCVPAGYKGILSDRADLLFREGEDDVAFWKKVFETATSDHAALIKADSAFFDAAILNEMYDIHTRYIAEFTYSENLPEGFACEIISRDLMQQIPDINEKTLPLGKIVKANINKFDVELYYKEPDIRDKRISFRISNPRDKKIMQNIYTLINRFPSYVEIKNIIDNNPEVLFTSPSYLELELKGSCKLDCIFCYRKTLASEHGDMNKSTLEAILSGMRNFNQPYTVCFGGSGEPLDHPEIYTFMELAAAEPLLEQLIIETNGLSCDSNFKTFIQRPENAKIKVIVNNNGMDAKSYTRLHGADKFGCIFNNLISLAELNSPVERIFIQIMKINETDIFENDNNRSYLDKFYDFWGAHKIPIILQKQNTYFGRIDDRRYSDLSPVKRTPCWHLQRDMYFLSDGSAVFCKQDIDGLRQWGNIKDTSLESIWNMRKDAFRADYREDYSPEPDCRNCDEWYTFNF